jgi:glycosyltransferase involved in cell wall biosynthesis
MSTAVTSTPDPAAPARTSRGVRILLIEPSLNILGGQAVHATRLIAGLRQAPGVDIQFQPINPLLPGPLAALQKIKYLRTVLTFLLYFSSTAARIPQYDVVHIFSASYYSYSFWSIPAILLAKLMRKKIILNYRDGQVDDHLRHWRSALPTIRLADKIVSPSGYMVEVFARYGLQARLISNIIDMAPFRYRQRSRLRPVFLAIAHDGPSRAGLEEMARELRLNATFLGRVPHERIAELYNTADIYLTSPDIDCMPGSLLECFASGLPVVATKAGGIPYIVKDETTGLLVDCNDHEALAGRCFRLLEDPALVERLTRNAYADVQKYRWENIRDQWLAVYDELTGYRAKVASSR